MADGIYAIGDFPDDNFLWRVEWIGGVGYNTSAPSDPLIDICLAQLPVGETNPLSPQSRASQIKKTVKIGVGLLPLYRNCFLIGKAARAPIRALFPEQNG
jgi:hypothetical protein